MLRSREFGAVALVTAVLLTAGCSSSGSAGGSAGGSSGGSSGSGSGGVPKTIAEALRDVHAAPTTKTDFAYGRYGAAKQYPYDEALTPVIGFSAKAPFVLTLGKAPNEVTVLYGTFDPAAIGTKLQGLGYKQTDRGHGETQWLIRDDHQFDMNQQPEALGAMLSTLNVIRVSKDRIVYGGATADLDAAVPAQSASLAADPAAGEIAKCLGADASGEFTTTYSVPLAVGIGSDGTETLCVAAEGDRSAQAYGDIFTTQITKGESVVSRLPWSQLLADPKAESLGGKAHVVRLTARSVTTGHLILPEALLNGDVATLIGLPAPAGKARRSASPSSSAS
ncbi:MAG: hypothetical protein JF587_02490 [Catenulisporales bacterium]|nr:hypothetical protein [Catenulisporales bacterium]